MQVSEIVLHYMEFNHKGKTYRLISSNFPKLQAGHYSSDIFGFFGFGSGEFWAKRIDGLPNVRLVEPDIDFVSAILYWRKRPEYVGFLDALPNQKPKILIKGDEVSPYDLINWNMYTQLGIPELATDTLRTMSRIHCAYPKLEQQVVRLKLFQDYANLTKRRP